MTSDGSSPTCGAEQRPAATIDRTQLRSSFTRVCHRDPYYRRSYSIFMSPPTQTPRNCALATQTILPLVHPTQLLWKNPLGFSQLGSLIRLCPTSSFSRHLAKSDSRRWFLGVTTYFRTRYCSHLYFQDVIMHSDGQVRKQKLRTCMATHGTSGVNQNSSASFAAARTHIVRPIYGGKQIYSSSKHIFKL